MTCSSRRPCPECYGGGICAEQENRRSASQQNNNSYDQKISETVARLFEADPHQYSSRPCQTCRAISSLLNRPFGCEKKSIK